MVAIAVKGQVKCQTVLTRSFGALPVSEIRCMLHNDVLSR